MFSIVNTLINIDHRIIGLIIALIIIAFSVTLIIIKYYKTKKRKESISKEDSKNDDGTTD